MTKPTLLALGITASLACTQLAHAAFYTEIGDAGQSYTTAQSTPLGGQSSDSIFGTLSSINDADIFVINISMPVASFSATTVNTETGAAFLDTALFLFDSSGLGVYANDDDASGTTLGSTLPAGSTFGPLAAGTYYLAISLSGNEPVDINGQLMFVAGTTATQIRTPNPNVTTPVADYDPKLVTSTTGGAYRIDIRPQAVPEPTSAVLLGLGALGLVAFVRKSRSSAV